MATYRTRPCRRGGAQDAASRAEELVLVPPKYPYRVAIGSSRSLCATPDDFGWLVLPAFTEGNRARRYSTVEEQGPQGSRERSNSLRAGDRQSCCGDDT